MLHVIHVHQLWIVDGIASHLQALATASKPIGSDWTPYRGFPMHAICSRAIMPRTVCFTILAFTGSRYFINMASLPIR